MKDRDAKKKEADKTPTHGITNKPNDFFLTKLSLFISRVPVNPDHTHLLFEDS